MLTPDEDDAVTRQTRTLQIIIGSLVAGLAWFLGIVLFLGARPAAGPGPGPGPAAAGAAGERLPVVSVTAVVVAATMVPLSIVVPGILAAEARKRLAAEPRGGDAARLLGVYQTRTIVAAAMTEGPAFLALIAYLLERRPFALALGAALIAGVALRFPRRAAVAAWVDDQLAALGLDRGAAG